MNSQRAKRSCHFHRHGDVEMVKGKVYTKSSFYNQSLNILSSFIGDCKRKSLFFLFWNSFNDFILNLFQHRGAVTINSCNQEFLLRSVVMIHTFVCVSSISHRLLPHSLSVLTGIAQTGRKKWFKIPCREADRDARHGFHFSPTGNKDVLAKSKRKWFHMIYSYLPSPTKYLRWR